MSSILGKRKSRSSGTTIAPEDAQEIFRRHFESQFKPLNPGDARGTLNATQAAIGPVGGDDDQETDTDSSNPGSEWDGISSADDDEEGDEVGDHGWDEAGEVEVVDHSSNPTMASAEVYSMTKQELRTYLSSRPPSLADGPRPAVDASLTKQQKRKKGPSDDPEDSADLLANDLALQRLLAESHLLSSGPATLASSFSLLNSSNGSGSDAAAAASGAATASFASGRLRRLTTDMRLRALGSRESIFAQSKMPMAQRRGIARAGRDREAARRKEARECGVVLERRNRAATAAAAPGASSSSSSGRRKRNGDHGGGGVSGIGRRVGMPGVGRMRGAELRISKKDIREVEGLRGAGQRKKKRR